MFDLVTVGMILILGGIAVVALALFGSVKESKGTIKGGGVVMIGPVPIVFGSDMKWASIAILLAIVLLVLSVIFYWV